MPSAARGLFELALRSRRCFESTELERRSLTEDDVEGVNSYRHPAPRGLDPRKTFHNQKLLEVRKLTRSPVNRATSGRKFTVVSFLFELTDDNKTRQWDGLFSKRFLVAEGKSYLRFNSFSICSRVNSTIMGRW